MGRNVVSLTWVEMSPVYSQARAVCVLKVSCVLPFVRWSPVSCCLCVGLLCLAVYVLKVSCVLLALLYQVTQVLTDIDMVESVGLSFGQLVA